MSADTPLIVVSDKPDSTDRDAILAALIAHNEAAFGPANWKSFGLLVKDPASGETVGGLLGRITYDWLFVEFLALPERYRGLDLGTKLLTQAEDLAREKGCVGVWLDTFDFQAPEFYAKLGYELFGTIDDHPRGHQRFFVQKKLV